MLVNKNNFDVISLKFSPREVDRLKREFARLLVKYLNNPERMFASMEYDTLFKGDISCGLFAINHWLTDPDVYRYKEEYVNGKNAADTMLTKEDVARHYLRLLEETRDEKIKLVTLRELSNLLGHLLKNNEVVTQALPSVMVVTDNGKMESWEEKLRINQQKLQDVEVDEPIH